MKPWGSTNGPLDDRYDAHLTPKYQLSMTTIVLYEMYMKIKRERGEETALLFAGRLNATQVVHLTESIAFLASDLSEYVE